MGLRFETESLLQIWRKCACLSLWAFHCHSGPWPTWIPVPAEVNGVKQKVSAASEQESRGSVAVSHRDKAITDSALVGTLCCLREEGHGMDLEHHLDG